MKVCQLPQAFVPFSCQFHLHPALVAAADAAPDQSGSLAPRNQRHDPVMHRLQTFGQFSYRRPFAPGETLDLKHQQILQRGYSLPARHLFAEAEITAQVVAEMSKPFQIGLGHSGDGLFRSPLFHGQSISRYDILACARARCARPALFPDATVESRRGRSDLKTGPDCFRNVLAAPQHVPHS